MAMAMNSRWLHQVVEHQSVGTVASPVTSQLNVERPTPTTSISRPIVQAVAVVVAMVAINAILYARNADCVDTSANDAFVWLLMRPSVLQDGVHQPVIVLVVVVVALLVSMDKLHLTSTVRIAMGTS
jgi:hypothetical protein